MLHNEDIESMYEYSPGKLILSLYPSDLMIVERWKTTRRIPALVKGNIEKFYIRPHPDFDESSFPFLVCSGFQYYMLVNVRENRLEKFIDAQSCAIRSQQAFFFLEEPYGYSLHFSRNYISDDVLELHKWHKMELKHDF